MGNMLDLVDGAFFIYDNLIVITIKGEKLPIFPKA